MINPHRIKYYIILTAIFCIAFFVKFSAAQDLDTDGLPILDGPVSIRDAVKYAIKNLPSIKTADSDIAAAKSRINAANAMTGFTASVTVFAGKSSAGDIITNPPDVSPANLFIVSDRSVASSQANLMFPLYTGGKLESGVKSADALYRSAISDKTVAELDAALSVRIAYHRVLEADAILEEITSLVSETTERARIADAFYKEGKIAKYDLLNSQAVLADAKQQLANAERDEKNALIDLKSLMGLSQTSTIYALAYLAFTPHEVSVDALLTTAMKDRPELVSIRCRIESAKAQIDAAKSAYKPQIYGQAMQGFSTGSGESESSYTIGISAGIPLVDRGLKRSRVDEAKAVLASMQAEESRLKLLIQQEVYTSYNELQAASKNVKLSDTAIEDTKENYRIMKLRNEAGKAVMADVIESLMNQVKATNNRVFSIHDYNIAWDRVLRAIGEPIAYEEQIKEQKK